MGWMGWFPEVALAADVNLIEMALSSRSDLLSTIFGSGKPETKGKKGKDIKARFRGFIDSVNGKNKDG